MDKADADRDAAPVAPQPAGTTGDTEVCADSFGDLADEHDSPGTQDGRRQLGRDLRTALLRQREAEEEAAR